jgi:hypothetical protein
MHPTHIWPHFPISIQLFSIPFTFFKFHHPSLSQPHFEASVRMKLTLPKVGTWSPVGLLKTQSLIAGVKTPRIDVFFILLKSS